MALMFAVYNFMALMLAELVVLQCVWLQIVLDQLQSTLIGLLCVTSIYNYKYWGLTTILSQIFTLMFGFSDIEVSIVRSN